MKFNVNVSISRQKRSNNGWRLVVGPNKFRAKSKAEACAMLLDLLSKMQIRIEPVPTAKEPPPILSWAEPDPGFSVSVSYTETKVGKPIYRKEDNEKA